MGSGQLLEGRARRVARSRTGPGPSWGSDPGPGLKILEPMGSTRRTDPCSFY